MKTKIVAGIIAFSMLVVIAGTALAAANEVYLDPQASKGAAVGDTADVEVWVNATEFAGGAINLAYDPTCANVTSWTRDTANFSLGKQMYYEGRVWITFSTMDPQPPVLTGTYRIGTLTIRCECEKGCVSPLEFIEGSSLFDDTGRPVPANWVNGTFTCETPQPECLGDCYDTPADDHNCTGKIIARNVTCNECLSAGTAASWHPTTRCPDRDLHCPDCWCFNECPDCADGIDNDQDGLIDCPEDDGCACCCDYTETPAEINPCVPELPTVALTGIGILSLVLWVRSRRGQKRE